MVLIDGDDDDGEFPVVHHLSKRTLATACCLNRCSYDYLKSFCCSGYSDS